jgi:hypothetical protein
MKKVGALCRAIRTLFVHCGGYGQVVPEWAATFIDSLDAKKLLALLKAANYLVEKSFVLISKQRASAFVKKKTWRHPPPPPFFLAY